MACLVALERVGKEKRGRDDEISRLRVEAAGVREARGSHEHEQHEHQAASALGDGKGEEGAGGRRGAGGVRSQNRRCDLI